MVESYSARELDDVAAGFPAVDALAIVLDGIGVEGVGHRDFEIANLLSATLIAGKTLRTSLFGLDPEVSFKCGDNLGLELLRQRKQVADMIGVAVSDENGIEPGQLFQIFR